MGFAPGEGGRGASKVGGCIGLPQSLWTKPALAASGTIRCQSSNEPVAHAEGVELTPKPFTLFTSHSGCAQAVEILRTREVSTNSDAFAHTHLVVGEKGRG